MTVKKTNIRQKIRVFAILLAIGGCSILAAVISFFIFEIEDTVYAGGVVEPDNLYEIVGHMDSRVVKLNVWTGMKVKKGDVLAVLDSSARETDAVAVRAEIMELEAELQTKRAEYDTLKLEPLPKELWHAATNLKEAEQKERTALDKLERCRGLEVKKAISKTELEKALVEHIQAVADLDRAKANCRRVEIGLGEKTLAKAESDVALIEARIRGKKLILENIEKQILDCRIIAPDDGVIVSIPCRYKMYASEDETAFVLASGGAVLLKCQVDQRFIRKVKIGQTAKISSEIYNRLKYGRFTGTVEKISQISDENGTGKKYTVRIRFSPENYDVKFGSHAEAAIFTGRRPAILALTNFGGDGD